ncbi:MAG: chemotaxis protein CheW [Chloroflexi bacterium]|nr:chemotaxis protein CheW [Chloroflexota bacterium]MCI0575185.1 chemotaxis protein CheW [Chloroflexota bacterium]MCI0647133.1 chemotaxis protein CheW [Chloroflexota bacterium]MCI0729991.1 chemotaxis protein CheW [Chloroflexota bacterium]
MLEGKGNGYSPADDGAGLSPVEALWEAEQELNPEELAQIWARRAYALAELPPAENQGQTLDLLALVLGGERYAVEVRHVREIYSLEQITPVPRTPSFVVGVFSARGRLLSVIDLRAFLGLPKLGLSGSRKIVAVTAGDAHLEVGLLADAVVDVLTVFEDDVESGLVSQAGAQTEYIRGVAPGMLAVLNLNALLNDKRLIVHEEVI